MSERPKRRKHRDNPYILEYCEKENKYIISFIDDKNILNKIEVNSKLYQEFDRFELDDLSELNEYDRHVEHSETYEITLHSRALDKPIGLEEIVENNIDYENLKLAIESLCEIQKRRIKMYYFEDMTLEKIATIEKCTKVAIKYSIDNAIENLKKFFKNNNKF